MRGVMREMNRQVDLRPAVPEPPRNWSRLCWLGPGLIWMVSSVGSGTILFTPRVGSRYGYELLWMMLAVSVLMWGVVHEVGRYTVVTGRTLLDGFRDLPGPRGWAIWLIFLPQLVAGVLTIAGIAALLGSILMNALPGEQEIYAVGAILVSSVLVISGRYKGVERTMSLLAVVLVGSAVAAAMMVFPEIVTLATGFVPALPAEIDYGFILPWVGFLLASAAGVIWFSYWAAARGYGGPVPPSENPSGAGGAPDSLRTDEERAVRLRSWQRILALAVTAAVVGTLVTNLAFIVLGAELLRPEGILPEGVNVAEDLTRLLGGVWGTPGVWILTTGMFVALWGTIISNLDGWPRLYADASILLFGPDKRGGGGLDSRLARWFRRENALRIRKVYTVVVATLLPLATFALVRDPVDLLSVAGSIGAAHLPIVVIILLILNRRRLPIVLRPGRLLTALLLLAALFFTLVSVMTFIG